MNTKNYIAPTIESESICVEQGIAISTAVLLDNNFFNDVIMTEEEVDW